MTLPRPATLIAGTLATWGDGANFEWFVVDAPTVLTNAEGAPCERASLSCIVTYGAPITLTIDPGSKDAAVLLSVLESAGEEIGRFIVTYTATAGGAGPRPRASNSAVPRASNGYER